MSDANMSQTATCFFYVETFLQPLWKQELYARQVLHLDSWHKTFKPCDPALTVFSLHIQDTSKRMRKNIQEPYQTLPLMELWTAILWNSPKKLSPAAVWLFQTKSMHRRVKGERSRPLLVCLRVCECACVRTQCVMVKTGRDCVI